MKIAAKIIQYDKQDISSFPKNNVWIRVTDRASESDIMAICDYYEVHKLTAEDTVNYSHQPKYDVNEYYSQILLKVFNVDDADKDGDPVITMKQISIIVGNSFILSFEQETFSYIDEYVKSLEYSKTKPLVKRIAFDLLDVIANSYLHCADTYKDMLDEVVDDMINSRYDYDLNSLFDLKRNIHLFRRKVRPALEMLEKISKPVNFSYTKRIFFLRKRPSRPYIQGSANCRQYVGNGE